MVRVILGILYAYIIFFCIVALGAALLVGAACFMFWINPMEALQALPVAFVLRLLMILSALLTIGFFTTDEGKTSLK